jgi:hypothetical protein
MHRQLIAFFLLGICTQAYSQGGVDPKIEAASAYRDSNPANPSAQSLPSVAIEPIPAHDSPTQPYSHARIVDEDSPSERKMVWLTAVLTLVAIFQFVTVIFQLLAFQKQQSEMRQKNRAYVGIKIPTITHVVAGQKPRVQLVLFNYGTTPAIKVRTTIAVEVGHQDTFTFPAHFQVAGDPSCLMPGADNTLHWRAVVIVEQDVIDAARIDEGKAVFVYGIIKYIDVFNGDCETSFRYRMIWYPTANEHRLAKCGPGNSIK